MVGGKNLNKVLVFGATGAQGSPVVKQLLAQGIDVRGVSRDAEKVKAAFGDTVEAVDADLSEPESLQRAFAGVDAAFFHLPVASYQPLTTALAHINNVVSAASNAKISRLVASTSGAADENLKHQNNHAVHIAITSTVLSSDIPSVVLIPTYYLENLLAPFSLGPIMETGELKYPPLSSTRKVSWTSLEDHAAFAVAALTTENVTGRSFDVTSPDPITGDELAALISQKVGRQVRYVPFTPQEFGALLGSFIGEEAGHEIASNYEQVDSLPPNTAIVDMTGTLKILPVQPTTIPDWVEKQDWKLS
jgi:uncharacterized protein YbjT (DUF2867 family)